MSNISVQLINHMGDDTEVAETARISFANDNFELPRELTENDERLIKFLARGITTKEYSELLDILTHGTQDRGQAVALLDQIKHQATHWTPFAHTAFKVKVSAPIPIRTQAFKHTIGLVANEESRRYIDGTPELFIPDNFRARPEGSIKQGSAGTHYDDKAWMSSYVGHCNEMIEMYEAMIEDGVSPEQARFVLPQGVMVNWVWTGNLVAFTNFFNKRADPHAQLEIQELAFKIKDAIAPLMPVSWEALTRKVG